MFPVRIKSQYQLNDDQLFIQNINANSMSTRMGDNISDNDTFGEIVEITENKRT